MRSNTWNGFLSLVQLVAAITRLCQSGALQISRPEDLKLQSVGPVLLTFVTSGSEWSVGERQRESVQPERILVRGSEIPKMRIRPAARGQATAIGTDRDRLNTVMTSQYVSTCAPAVAPMTNNRRLVSPGGAGGHTWCASTASPQSGRPSRGNPVLILFAKLVSAATPGTDRSRPSL